MTVVSHNDAARMLFNGKEINREELAPALKAALAEQANWEVHVEGDDSVPYADPMHVVDVVDSLYAKAVILTPQLKEQIAAAKCSPR